VGPRIEPGAVDARWLTGCAWLHLPAYSLVSWPVRDAALAAAGQVAHRSLDLSSTAAVAEFGIGRFRKLAARLAPDVVFGTEAEAAMVGDIPGAEMVVKLGPEGARVGGRVYPAVAAVPVDSTGAGDAFAAGYLVGGVDLALRAAARAVSRMGAMP
jgi:sugar/nucleoside kinase (ribokinase family)